jgi:hypothetical protein
MQPVQPQPPLEDLAEPSKPAWYYKLGMVLFIVVCFEVGLFLLLFPWMQYWRNNSIAGLAPWLRQLWNSSFFRGALSGVGMVNLYISIAEIIRLRRRISARVSPADRLKVSVL